MNPITPKDLVGAIDPSHGVKNPFVQALRLFFDMNGSGYVSRSTARANGEARKGVKIIEQLFYEKYKPTAYYQFNGQLEGKEIVFALELAQRLNRNDDMSAEQTSGIKILTDKKADGHIIIHFTPEPYSFTAQLRDGTFYEKLIEQFYRQDRSPPLPDLQRPKKYDSDYTSEPVDT